MRRPRVKTVLEHEVSEDEHGSQDNAVYSALIKEEVLRNGIVRPKGYNVSWHLNPEIEKPHFGVKHPMKPFRLTLTKSLVMSYGMHVAMDSYLSRMATPEELEEFHASDYIEFLRTAMPRYSPTAQPGAFGLGAGDCPIFQGLFEHCSLYAGASVDAARKLINNQSDIAINWSGGLHHARKGSAFGFCYINDVVLAILELLRYHPRVLYIDIDVHHGDGVEQAFWSSDRVMTLSFHKYDPTSFFPYTGGIDTTGPKDPRNPGAHHSLNVPLNDGITDAQYTMIFQKIVNKCIEHYRPTAIVLQCGADSLVGDPIGTFNLQVKAHAACVAFCKRLNLPLLLLGGGGYRPRNVARAWALETAVAIGCDKKLNEEIPAHTPFRSYFGPPVLCPNTAELGITPKINANSKKQLDKLVQAISEQLRYLKGAPSVQMQTIPPDVGGIRQEVEDELREEREERDGDFRRRRENGLGIAGELW
ncbi:MAG: hypothetical protein LQ347_004115 [Umbilicaria vellea]|nr:MAG: hypothetical protein LQ347_004115 [Umbilicaria vellea]